LRDFGAVGDGVADDGPAFQSALDALAAAGGGTLFVPEGKYAIVTPVEKDFTGLASSITIMGVESLTPVAPPSAGGAELSLGLDLHTEVYPRTGEQQVAIFIKGLRNLVVKDIAFVGTATVVTDAQSTLYLSDIGKAQIKHSEFYGLATMTGYGIVVALRSDLEMTQCKFLGSTATSGLYIPIVQNLEWYGITVTDTTFLDYGQRPELFSKTGYAAPVSWINIGNAAQKTNLSPRREVVLRNVFLDEGGYWGLTCFPYRYPPESASIDLIYITNLEMNVSNFGQYGHYLWYPDRLFVEKSRYGWSHFAAAAMSLNYIGSAILDQVKLEESADHIVADENTGELTVINSTNVHLISSAHSTITIDTTPEADPVQYVRSRFVDVLGRDPDPAAHVYWSDLLLHCFEDSVCQDSAKQALNDYLSSSPSKTFSISGRITTVDDNAPLGGVKVTLSGSQSVATNTDSNGNYIFTNLPTSGRYVVTPTLGDYGFESATFITPNGDQTANFTARPKTFLVKGTVRSGDTPLPGVVVALSGFSVGTTVTDDAGEYSFELLKGKDYVLTPASAHYTFTPGSFSINSLNANAQIDFNATLRRHSIVGRVMSSDGLPVAGVVVALSGFSLGTTVTDGAGEYSFQLLNGKDYVLTPAKANYTFAPGSFSINSLNADAQIDFKATRRKHSIAGHVMNSDGVPVAGVVMTLSGPVSSTTTSSNDGSYSFTNLDAGASWTVTAARTNFALLPGVQTFVDLSADAVANFEAVQLPVLLTEAGSDSAVAMELTQWVPEPFSITTTLLSDGRNTTRIIMFATDLNLQPGEGIEALTAEAEDAEHVLHPLRVEFVSPLPGLPQINQVVVRLTRDLDRAGNVLITLKVHGLTSNKARIIVGPVNDDSN